MELGEKINKIYEKKTFFEKFGKDVIFALVIGIVLIGINIYLYIINNLKGLRNKWNDTDSPINCNPLYMPFASIINPPPDGNNLKYIEDNANQCIQKGLQGQANTLANPVAAVLDTLINALKGVVEILIEFIVIMGKIVDSTILLLNNLNFSMNESITLNNNITYSISSVMDIFTTIITVFGYIGEGFSLFGMSLINSVNPAACFDKNTTLLMKDGYDKKISDIMVGDELLYDGYVTSIMKLTSNNVQMYVYNDVIVSGSHYVYEGDCIRKIENSVNSKPYYNYNEKEIYCITTESKQIHIKNIVFSDYDDLSIDDCNYLKKWISNKYSKQSVKSYDIHTYMNGGLLDTSIKMQSGITKMLSDIKINDILDNNITVLGVVKVYPKDIQLKTLAIEQKQIIGGSNIQIMDKYKHCSLNAIDSKYVIENNDKPLYHLITNKGGYFVNDIYIGDYSIGMGLFFKDDINMILSVI